MPEDVGDEESGEAAFVFLDDFFEFVFQSLPHAGEAEEADFLDLREADEAVHFFELLAVHVDDFVGLRSGAEDGADGEEFFREGFGVDVADAAEPAEHFAVRFRGGG